MHQYMSNTVIEVRNAAVVGPFVTASAKDECDEAYYQASEFIGLAMEAAVLTAGPIAISGPADDLAWLDLLDDAGDVFGAFTCEYVLTDESTSSVWAVIVPTGALVSDECIRFLTGVIETGIADVLPESTNNAETMRNLLVFLEVIADA